MSAFSPIVRGRAYGRNGGELYAKNMISGTAVAVKILGDGEIEKKLTVKAAKFSESAKAKIEAAGGKAEVL